MLTSPPRCSNEAAAAGEPAGDPAGDPAGLPAGADVAGGLAAPVAAPGLEPLDEQAATTSVVAARAAAMRDRRLLLSSLPGSPFLDHRPGDPGRSPGLRQAGRTRGAQSGWRAVVEARTTSSMGSSVRPGIDGSPIRRMSACPAACPSSKAGSRTVVSGGSK